MLFYTALHQEPAQMWKHLTEQRKWQLAGALFALAGLVSIVGGETAIGLM